MRKRLLITLGLIFGLSVISICSYIQFSHAETIDWNHNPNGVLTGIVVRLPNGTSMLCEVTFGDTPVYVRPYAGSLWGISNWPSFFTDRLVYDTQLDQFKFTGNDLKVVFSNSTIGVTGTFWQATQPVSIASMPSTPVTGTFWQATQPVSIASMPSTPVTNQAFTDATDVNTGTYIKPASGASWAVTGTFWPSDVTLVDSTTMIQDYTLTDSTVTYSVAVPAKCVGYEFCLNEDVTLKWSNVSGGMTAHFYPLKSGKEYSTLPLGNSTLYSGTLYFNCPTQNNVTLCIIFWLKP